MDIERFDVNLFVVSNASNVFLILTVIVFLCAVCSTACLFLLSLEYCSVDSQNSVYFNITFEIIHCLLLSLSNQSPIDYSIQSTLTSKGFSES